MKKSELKKKKLKEELNEKVFALWAELKETDKITNYEIATGIGVSNSSVHGWDKDGGKPTMASLKKLLDFFVHYKKNKDKEQALKEQVEILKDGELDGRNIIPAKMVPLVPIRARASYLTCYYSTEYIDSLPLYPIVPEFEFRGRYMIFEVEGDSMNDGTSSSILDGDKVLCRNVSRDLWRSMLHIKDWFFVIVHRTDGIIIKEIVDHNVDKATITCHSLNPMYGEDFEIHLDDVAELYNAVRVIDRQIRK